MPLLNPNSVLGLLSQMTLPAASESSLIRVIRGTPDAVASWERAVEKYHNLSLALDYGLNEDPEDIGWMYSPLLNWPSKNSRFIADVISALDEFTGTIVLPTAYAEFRTAVIAFNGAHYPNGSAVYHMLGNYDGANDSAIVVSDVQDAEVDPATYVDDDVIGAGTAANVPEAVTLLKKVNNVIFHTQLADAEVDLTSSSTIPVALSYTVAFTYLVMKFLRDEISSTYRPGNFVSAAQWTTLSTAGAALLTN